MATYQTWWWMIERVSIGGKMVEGSMGGRPRWWWWWWRGTPRRRREGAILDLTKERGQVRLSTKEGRGGEADH